MSQCVDLLRPLSGFALRLYFLFFLYLVFEIANFLPKPVYLSLILLFVLSHLVQILPDLSDEPRLLLYFELQTFNLSRRLSVFRFHQLLLLR